MNILVYCGSRKGHDPFYAELARTVGLSLATHNCGLVYGGGSVGLMGILADTVLQNGGTVIGVIPTFLAKMEVELTTCTELIEVPSMHIRKQLMIDRCDAIMALPGAYGTLDELFEALTWLQLGLHDRPIGILNVNGFYDHLLGQLDRMASDGFLTENNRAMIAVEEDVDFLIDRLVNGPARPLPGSFLSRS